MSANRKITVPQIDGRKFNLADAAALCALSRFGRIFRDARFRAWVWWAQRYVAAWITPRRFFDHAREFGSGLFVACRENLVREGLITVETEGAYFCSPLGNILAAKLRAAMPEAMAEGEFANERARAQHERMLRRRYIGA